MTSHSTTDSDKPALSYNRTLIVVILIAGAFVSVLNQTLMLVAIPPIMQDFQADASLAQWITTAFMMASGLLIPVTAALIDRYSSRTLYLTALLIFTVGTVLGAAAQTFTMLLLARIIQGAAAGIIMPMIQTLMMTMFPLEKRGTAMGLVGLVISFAPAIGPTLSGWIIDHFSWRYLFVLMIPIALVVIVATFFFMKNVTHQRPTRIDALSVTLSSFGWGGLLYGFSIAGSAGWTSPSVLISLIIGAVSLTFFVRRQLDMPMPLLDFKVFQSPVFTLTSLQSILVFTLLISTQTLIPLYIQGVRGQDALHTGLVLLPGAVIMGMVSPVAGRMFDAFGIERQAIVGFLLLAGAMLFLAMVPEDIHYAWIMAGSIGQMLGATLLMMPLITAGVNSLPGPLIAHAAAMNNTLRMVGASIGTALLITVLSTRAALFDSPKSPEALAAGIHLAFWFAFGLAILGLAMSLWLHRYLVRSRRNGAVG
ncbi:DHA2 family efflux MFS transporter permease subunit [Saccharospirillum salsuginis]|uniref:MFS-type transporter YcnB n=1 Tax=Saccharospirillum salsuginis TaxID=418750 RepID=A0A918KR54_9GAMM|nr:DHA2 family efflux MFS transporter permease subunit [Saccharospirillum salsuginis]GGX73631.1 putative MFS-type transporter YcnB [Saccharospirillum salsuginis]